MTVGNVTSPTETELKDMREAGANLSAYLQGLPVSNYQVPPVTSSAPGGVEVVVNMTLLVVSVSDVNDAENTLTILSYVIFSWTDQALAWNVSDHSGVQSKLNPTIKLKTIVFVGKTNTNPAAHSISFQPLQLFLPMKRGLVFSPVMLIA